MLHRTEQNPRTIGVSRIFIGGGRILRELHLNLAIWSETQRSGASEDSIAIIILLSLRKQVFKPSHSV